YRKGFAPDMPGFRHVPFNDIAALRESVVEDTCAVLIEPVQGEGGVIPADPEFLKAARALCDDRGVLLLFDEVQCGMGRTGSLFAFQHYGVEPDGFSLAKALGNGFPIGAFVIREKYREVFSVGSHASTFGGTPLACAAACAVLDTIGNDNLLSRCREASKEIFSGLEKIKVKFGCIKEIRGLGLMIGVVMDDKADGVRKLAQDKGLLVLTAGENVLRLLPPLNVRSEEISAALEIIEQAFGDYSEKKT
ncbi:MAG: aminotransferase class III-fold pyridoxal phosphate-dependent enzyme, partial [Victivallales bacterium]|nr:aminotransferase class III-fold pyridoxal phosphate-dependent enzyme [Victivallales bacterium]